VHAWLVECLEALSACLSLTKIPFLSIPFPACMSLGSFEAALYYPVYYVLFLLMHPVMATHGETLDRSHNPNHLSVSGLFIFSIAINQ
jgi:hypothetical protein